MKILALDTAGMTASAAIVDEHKTIAEYTIDFKHTHSQTIMPMIEQITKMIELDLNSIDYIACSCGPGSFTGLRIGAATAKGLALGLNKKIVPVPTLDALAYNIFKTDKLIVPIIDARRNQVYSAIYVWDNLSLKRLTDYIADDINILLKKTIDFNSVGAIFLGDGVNIHKDTISEFNSDYIFAPPNINMQKASSVGALALEYAEMGKFVDSRDFELIYLRKSQAEREYDERNIKLC